MGNFAIMRWGKIKFDGVSNAEYHQRTELHKNCEHPELREQNFTFRQFEDETLRQTTKRLMAAQQERTGRAVRKDATVMVDFVLTFSPEMVGKIDMGAWFKANVDWLHREFGAKNLLRLDMHFHESCPHLHAISYLPMAISLFITAYLQSVGSVNSATLVSMLRGIILSAILLYVLPLLMGGSGIWWAVTIAESGAAIVGMTYMMPELIKIK